KIRKLSAICLDCKLEAFFTLRTSKNTELVMIGGKATYTSQCRSCLRKSLEDKRRKEDDTKKETSSRLKAFTCKCLPCGTKSLEKNGKEEESAPLQSIAVKGKVISNLSTDSEKDTSSPTETETS